MKQSEWNTRSRRRRGLRLALIALFGLLGAQGIGCGAEDACVCDVQGACPED